MSGEPKTLTQMTPREAWEVAWEQAIDTARVVMEEEAFAKQLEAMRNLGRQFIDQEPVGVRVVARDEVSELVEKYREYTAQLRDALGDMIHQFGAGSGWRDEDQEAALRKALPVFLGRQEGWRDEASELAALKAAALAWEAAVQAFEAGPPKTLSAERGNSERSEYRRAEDALGAAMDRAEESLRQVVRRLAGGENEK